MQTFFDKVTLSNVDKTAAKRTQLHCASVLQTCLPACCVCVWLVQCTVRRSLQTWQLFPPCQRKLRICMPASTRSKRSAPKTFLTMVSLKTVSWNWKKGIPVWRMLSRHATSWLRQNWNLTTTSPLNSILSSITYFFVNTHSFKKRSQCQKERRKRLIEMKTKNKMALQHHSSMYWPTPRRTEIRASGWLQGALWDTGCKTRQHTVADQSQRIVSLETSSSDTSKQCEQLEATCSTLLGDHKLLKPKLADPH